MKDLGAIERLLTIIAALVAQMAGERWFSALLWLSLVLSGVIDALKWYAKRIRKKGEAFRAQNNINN